METLYGSPAADGIASGKLKMIRHGPGTEPSARVQKSPEEELSAFRLASAEADKELSELKTVTAEQIGEEEAEIFEIHRMMMSDEDFTDRITDGILNRGLSAVESVQRAGEELSKIFGAMDTEYMRARAADIRSVAARLRDILDGGGRISYDITSPCIVASDDLTPAETVRFDKKYVLGIVTELGSRTSHTAILARSMGIPAVVGMSGITDDMEGRHCILDGGEGTLLVDPDEAALTRFRSRLADQAEETRMAEAMRGVCLTDSRGKAIRIAANAADLRDVEAAVAFDAEGIGLFRSEFLFMQQGRVPTEEEQFEAYRAAAVCMADRECVIRTLDAGADKQIPYLNGETEANPALGMRAVRLCLREPDLLFTQFRALYRAAAFGNLSAMIPMVVLPSEMEAVRDIAKRAKDSLRGEGMAVGPLRIGMMIETPAAAVTADLFAPYADFFSIGTNDLIQYTLAADRENRNVAYLSEPLPACVKRLIRMTCEAAGRHSIPVSVCGEMGSDKRYIGFLLDCGVTRLSVNPPHILRVRLEADRYLKQKKQEKTI